MTTMNRYAVYTSKPYGRVYVQATSRNDARAKVEARGMTIREDDRSGSYVVAAPSLERFGGKQ